MYFDAVLDKDTMPIYNDTPEAVKKWLVDEPSWEKRWVCVGETMQILTEDDYLSRT